MKRSAKEYRQEFEELGYTVFAGVLTQEEIDYALPITIRSWCTGRRTIRARGRERS